MRIKFHQPVIPDKKTILVSLKKLSLSDLSLVSERYLNFRSLPQIIQSRHTKDQQTLSRNVFFVEFFVMLIKAFEECDFKPLLSI